MQRMTVREAANALGISENGVRQRITRGTLESEKDDNGRVYVWVKFNDEDTHNVPQAVLEAKDEVIATLRAQVEAQQKEIEDWKEEARRKDHLLASLMQRIPELEPVREESPVTSNRPSVAQEEQTKGSQPPDPETAKTEPWWRRIFR